MTNGWFLLAFTVAAVQPAHGGATAPRRLLPGHCGHRSKATVDRCAATRTWANTRAKGSSLWTLRS